MLQEGELMANSWKRLGKSKFTDLLPTVAAMMWHSIEQL
jgi:hypothetical protein